MIGMGKQPYHEWEIKHGLLNDKQIDGFQYWNYMRRDMFMSFDDEYADVEPPFYKNMKGAQRETFFKKIKKTFRILLPAFDKGIGHSDVLFLCHPRRQEINGKMVSIYTDYIADKFPGSVTLQRSGLGKYNRDEIYTKKLVFMDKICIRSFIYRHLVKIFTPRRYDRVRRSIYRDMEEPFRDLASRYGLHPDADDFAERAAALYFFYKYRKPRFTALLEKISPRIIAEVVGGSFDAEIINEIATELGIETVELQHGTGALTICYPDGYDIRQFAKWYFTFGDFWTKAMKAPVPKDHMLSMGFPYHDMVISDYPKENQEHDDNTVIFLSSRKYGEALSRVAAELKKLRPETHVIYKLHPREYADYKEKYTALKDAGLEIIDDNASSLYGLFSRCSMQVGVESTAIYEGMSFSLTTYIWDIPKAALMKELIESGYATLFKDAGMLAALIDSRDREKEGYDMEVFWKGGSMENIVDGIKRVGKLNGFS